MDTAEPASPRTKPGEYVVVARRYRPQSFEQLVGQQQVSQALGKAISTSRVGHAYLFTGARGVGKTSTARIFAKALNCVRGPTPTPCNECDICESIAVGEDVDVLEIDGASNRGIDEIRQLRSNVNIRPSRARFKIYIIDEVHMLTLPAFNALLKTLEEPPEHVKFIFCTTDADKIPITILSRCQRFDFPPVEATAIVDRLRFIVEKEGVSAEDEALQLLARRANGSLRDSQSLLEQLLSSCPERITVADVHAMLGTARSGQLTTLADELAARNIAGAFREVNKALSEGVDPGQLAEQLLGFFRDVMTAAVGCGPDLMLYSMSVDHPRLVELGRQFGLETLLAMVQILDQSVTRMRHSPHVRTLLEVALVRICQLESLDQLSQLVEYFRQGGGGQAAARPAAAGVRALPGPGAPAAEATQKKSEPLTVSGAGGDGRRVAAAHAPIADKPSVALGAPLAPRGGGDEPPRAVVELTASNLEKVWKETLATLEGILADFARHAERLELPEPERLVAHFRGGYHKEYCERADRKVKLEEALAQVTGRTVRLGFELLPAASVAEVQPQPVPSTRQRWREKEKNPLVRRAVEMFDAEIVRIEDARPGVPPSASSI